MDGFLKLRVEYDELCNVELFAEFGANGFTGCGSAWFTIQELKDKAALLAQYPLPKDSPVSVRGGYWISETKTIEELHLSISFCPEDARGTIVVKVEACSNGVQRPGHHAAVELFIDYETLSRFSRQFAAMLRGDVKEVIMHEIMDRV